MKRWYKILAICVVMICAAMLGGCTKKAQLSSEMTVEDDGSGTRKIQIELDKNLVKRGFKGGQKNLEDLMDQYCPEEFTWKVDEQKNTYDLTLTLEFDSLEAYAKKAGALAGEKNIQWKDLGEGLSVGFSLEEKVTAEAFLTWMKDALVKEAYIKRSEKNQLFRLGKTYFSHAGDRQAVNDGKIQYEYRQDYDAEQMVFLTQPDLGEAWNRVIYVYFPSALMEGNAAQVQKFMQNRISDATQMDWLSQTCVRLTFSGRDVYGMSQAMKLFFGQSACRIEETMESETPFSFGYQYEEYMDVADFAPKTGTLPVYYYVKDAASGDLAYRAGEQEKEAALPMPESGSQEMQDQIETAIETEGYHMEMGQSVESKTIRYDMDCLYGAKAVDVSSVVRDSRSISRSITVMYDRVPLSAHQYAIQEDFETKVGQKGYVEIVEEDEGYGVRVSQEGTFEELADLFSDVYGGRDQVSYKRDKITLLTPSANGYMEETLDFSAFLPAGTETELTYGIRFESGDAILKDTLLSTAQKEDGEQVIKTANYTATVGGSGFHIEFTTKIKNMISMPLMALIAFLTVAVLIWYLHGPRWQRMMQRAAPVYGTCREWIQSRWTAHKQSMTDRHGAWKDKGREQIQKIKDTLHRKKKDGSS